MYRPGEKTYYTTFSPDAVEIQKGFPWNGKDMGYHFANLGAVMSLMPPPPADVLDAGCGAGFTSRVLAMRGYRVTGIDVNTDLLSIAANNRWRDEQDRLSFVEHDYEEPFLLDAVDAVLFYDSLHHSMRPQCALQMAYSALRKGGVCVAVEPGVGHSWSPEAQRIARDMDVTEESTPPVKVARLAKRVGFRVKGVYPHFGVLERTIFEPRMRQPNLLLWAAHRIRFSLIALILGKWLNGIIVLQKGNE